MQEVEAFRYWMVPVPERKRKSLPMVQLALLERRDPRIRELDVRCSRSPLEETSYLVRASFGLSPRGLM